MFRNFRVICRISTSKFRTSATQTSNNQLDTIIDANTRLLKVAIIGIPNAGKSTLINSLMDRRVCPTSSKVHTTRAKCMAVYTQSNSQIVFLDTPGLVNIKEHKRYNLGRSFIKDGKVCLNQADIIGVIHDVSNEWTRHRLDIKIVHLLEEFKHTPSVLIFNKVDVLKSKRKLLDLVRTCTENCFDGKPLSHPKQQHKSDDNDNLKGWPHFQEIFMVSALTGNGLPELKDYFTRNAKPGKWMFPGDIWSDQTAEDLVLNNVKAKLLDYLPQEIPYQLRPELELFGINDEGVVSTVVLVHCPSERVAKLIAGVSDGRLRQITESLQHDLQETFQNFVRIKIVLQSKDKK